MKAVMQTWFTKRSINVLFMIHLAVPYLDHKYALQVEMSIVGWLGFS